MNTKSKIWGLILALIIMPVAFLFSACGNNNDKLTVSSYEFVDCVTEYTDTDSFSVTGKLVLTMSDGSTKEVKLTNEMLDAVPDLTTLGEKEVSFTYNGEKYILTIKVVESNATKNAKAIKKLNDAIKRYNEAKDKGADVSVSIDLSYFAKFLTENVNENMNLLDYEISKDTINKYDVLGDLMSSIANSTIDGENADILKVLLRNVPTTDDKKLQEVLDLLSVKGVVYNNDLVKLFEDIYNGVEISKIYDTVADLILTDENSELYAEAMADYIYRYLSIFGVEDYGSIYDICSGVLKFVKDYDNMAGLLAMSYEGYSEKIVSYILDEIITADMVTNYIADKYNITDAERIEEIKQDVLDVYEIIKDKDELERYLSGQIQIDYLDLIVNKVLLPNTNTYYAEKLSDVVSRVVKINSAEGKAELKDFFVSVLPYAREYIVTGETVEAVDWEQKLIDLATIIVENSEQDQLEFINYVKGCYEEKNLQELVYDLFFGDLYTLPIDEMDGGKWEIYNTICGYYRQLNAENANSTKILIKYAIYRDYDTFVEELTSSFANYKAIRKEANNYMHDKSVCVWDDEEDTWYGNGYYNGNSFMTLYFYSRDSISISADTIYNINEAITSKYADLIKNFLNLDLDKQFAEDLYKLATGELESMDNVMNNFFGSIEGYIKTNKDGLKSAIIDLGDLIGLDMNTYLEQDKNDEPITLIEDLVNLYLKAENVEIKNNELFGEHYNEFDGAISDFTRIVDSLIFGEGASISDAYEQFKTSFTTIANIINDNDIQEIAYFENYAGRVKTIPASYIYMAWDLTYSELTTDEKVSKYVIPMLEADPDYWKQYFTEALYVTIMHGDLDTEEYYDYENHRRVEKLLYLERTEYQAVEKWVDKYFEEFVNETIDWTEAKNELIEITNENAPKLSIAIINSLDKIDLKYYYNAIMNGATKEEVMAQIEEDLDITLDTFIETFKDDIAEYIALGMTTILNLDDAVKIGGVWVDTYEFIALKEWAIKYLDFYLNNDSKLTIENIKADLDEIIETYCVGNEYETEIFLGSDIVDYLIYDLTGDLPTDLKNISNIAISAYKDYLVEVISYRLTFIFNGIDYNEFDELVIVNQDLYDAFVIWANDYIDDYITGDIDLDAMGYDFLTIVGEYCEDREYSVVALVLRDLNGDLEHDLQILADNCLKAYKEEVIDYVAKEFAFNFLNWFDEDADKYRNTLKLSRDFFTYVYEVYMNREEVEVDYIELAKRFMKLINDCETLDTSEKTLSYVIIMPFIVESGVIEDYNDFFKELIDIKKLTNGAIESIDYNALVEQIFSGSFIIDCIDIPEVITTEVVFDESGRLVSETLVYVISYSYDAKIMGLDAKLSFKVKINY